MRVARRIKDKKYVTAVVIQTQSKIKQYRTAKGISILSMAHKLRMPVLLYYYYENTAKNIKLGLLGSISKILEIPLHSLFPNEEELITYYRLSYGESFSYAIHKAVDTK